ncbi:hypothetical protein BN948_01796 [Hydrogenophaga intermedia]|uniref:Uncharacterized protein n=1 Tax=Hydrogenophaga intermedia TaxID=65786 RepID=A0A1L1PF04_HYDIT|nr:hypothetical protein [Hydrogenophaga intermedia]CDN87374.1 hypothetical protein BN948_01796 [Hydrogenophaga intermedia]
MQVELIEPEVAPGSEATGSDLVTLPPPKRAALALNTEKTEAALRGAVEKHKGITEIKDKAGRDQCHGAAMELMRLRTGVGGRADEVRADAKLFNAAVLAEEKRLVAIVEPEEKRLKTLRDAWDKAEQERKAEAARLEGLRKAAIAARIGEVNEFRNLAKQSRTSTMVQSLIDKLTALWDGYDVKARFEEFADDAGVAYRITLQHMQATLKEKADAEAEAERQRLERERLAEERRQQEAAAAKLQAEREAFERERKAFLEQAQQHYAPAPAEPAAVESMVDLSEPEVIGVDLASGPDISTPTVEAKSEVTRGHFYGSGRRSAPRESVPDPFATETPPAPAPQPPAAQDDVVDAEVSAGFDAAMSAPLPERNQPATDAPPAESIVKVIAEAYGVPRSTAIDWLVIRADDIFNLDDGEAA